MYQPEMNDPDPRYPAFKAPKGHMIPGFGGKEVAVALALLAAGIALVLGTGAFKTCEEVEADPAQRQAELSQLAYYRDYLAAEEAGQSGMAFADPSRADEAHEAADRLGITARTADSQLESMVARTRTVEHDLVSLPVRIGALVVLPVGTYVGLTLELSQGSCMKDELARYLRSRREQREYAYSNPFCTTEGGQL